MRRHLTAVVAIMSCTGCGSSSDNFYLSCDITTSYPSGERENETLFFHADYKNYHFYEVKYGRDENRCVTIDRFWCDKLSMDDTDILLNYGSKLGNTNFSTYISINRVNGNFRMERKITSGNLADALPITSTGRCKRSSLNETKLRMI